MNGRKNECKFPLIKCVYTFHWSRLCGNRGLSIFFFRATPLVPATSSKVYLNGNSELCMVSLLAQHFKLNTSTSMFNGKRTYHHYMHPLFIIGRHLSGLPSSLLLQITSLFSFSINPFESFTWQKEAKHRECLSHIILRTGSFHC